MFTGRYTEAGTRSRWIGNPAQHRIDYRANKFECVLQRKLGQVLASTGQSVVAWVNLFGLETLHMTI